MGEDATGISVLLVDDQLMFAQSLGRLLQDESDIEVVGTAATGAEALQMATTLCPDVVLLDYQLPDQDGAAVAAEIRRRNADTMVVMLTGSTDERTLIAAVEAGCSGFITKDQAAASVAAAVRSAAAGEALISPAVLARLLPKLRRMAPAATAARLTDREREILTLLAGGSSSKAIASTLHLSHNTVRNHVQSILSRLGAHSKLEAVSIAVQGGLIEFPPPTP